MAYCERGTIKISRAANGFTVTMRDPGIEKRNAQRSLKERTSGPMEPYIDPDKEYVFGGKGDEAKALKDALAFVAKNAAKAMPKENFESAFEALADEDD